jgi:hypothetical protein
VRESFSGLPFPSKNDFEENAGAGYDSEHEKQRGGGSFCRSAVLTVPIHFDISLSFTDAAQRPSMVLFAQADIVEGLPFARNDQAVRFVEPPRVIELAFGYELAHINRWKTKIHLMIIACEIPKQTFLLLTAPIVTFQGSLKL